MWFVECGLLDEGDRVSAFGEGMRGNELRYYWLKRVLAALVG